MALFGKKRYPLSPNRLLMENLATSRADERERTEEELLAQIRAAGEVYLAAVAEYARISKEYRNMLDHPDGALALHKAATNERIAFEKYSETLEALTKLILQKRPTASANETES
jgi:hypothetical protein